jgi:hypothetical protein
MSAAKVGRFIGENNPSFGSGTSVFIYHFNTGYFIDSFSSIGKAAESLNVGFARHMKCVFFREGPLI